MRVMGFVHTLGSSLDNNSDSVIYLNQIPRFCYRQDFEPISDSKYKTDRGWGCCLRSTQSMIAQFILHLYNLYPTLYMKTFSNYLASPSASPLSLFFDTPKAPFSIHNIIANGDSTQLTAGEWAKPSVAAESISNIFHSLGLNCTIFRDFLISPKLENVSYPCLLLMPGLFGLNKFDVTFLPLLEAEICMEGSLGFISGKGNSAYYVVGFDDKNFIYFDPHYTKPAFTKESTDDIQSLYSIQPKRIRTDKINPSILIGIMLHSPNDLENLQIVMTGINDSPFSILEKPSENSLDNVMDIDDLDLDDNAEEKNEKIEKDENTS